MPSPYRHHQRRDARCCPDDGRAGPRCTGPRDSGVAESLSTDSLRSAHAGTAHAPPSLNAPGMRLAAHCRRTQSAERCGCLRRPYSSALSSSSLTAAPRALTEEGSLSSCSRSQDAGKSVSPGSCSSSRRSIPAAVSVEGEGPVTAAGVPLPSTWTLGGRLARQPSLQGRQWRHLARVSGARRYGLAGCELEDRIGVSAVGPLPV